MSRGRFRREKRARSELDAGGAGEGGGGGEAVGSLQNLQRERPAGKGIPGRPFGFIIYSSAHRLQVMKQVNQAHA